MREERMVFKKFGGTEIWRIYHHPYSIAESGMWYWQYEMFGFVVKRSKQDFSYLNDCLQDAIKHGLPCDSDTAFHKLPKVNRIGCAKDLIWMAISGIVVFLIWGVWLPSIS